MKYRNDEKILEEIESENELERKIEKEKVSRFVANIPDETTKKKLDTIKALAKQKIKGKESEINSYILKRAIDLLYASNELKELIGEEKYNEILNRKPFDVEL